MLKISCYAPLMFMGFSVWSLISAGGGCGLGMVLKNVYTVSWEEGKTSQSSSSNLQTRKQMVLMDSKDQWSG